ncbi:MAG: hypothetical protein GAK45_00629 [Pseudomonas citronellolis]|nr:MAG: hypothetical protein GAK45_00629 [Pseudomonas citronellolis]
MQPTATAPRPETVSLVYQIFGDVLVPLEQVRERWFRNLNRENFGKALACGRIALPVTTLDDSHKAMQYVAVDHLAAYVEQRALLADSNLAQRRAQTLESRASA